MTALLAAVIIASAPLDDAREAYQSGRLNDARERLEPLLYPVRFDDPVLERDARLLLAATYFALGDANRAEEEAIRAWGLAPSQSPDPLLFPPDFIAFHGEVKDRHGARIAALAASTKKSSDAPTQPTPTQVTAAPPPAQALQPAQPVGLAWSFVPLGAPQFQQGRTTPGAVLATAQGVCLATAVTGLAGALSLRGADGLYASRDAPTARVLNTAWVAGAWCFLGVYGYGVFDALVHR